MCVEGASCYFIVIVIAMLEWVVIAGHKIINE
jgi:hypothetical protein